MRSLRRFFSIIAAAFAALIMSSCGHGEGDRTDVYKIFFPEEGYASIISEERTILPENSSDMVSALLNELEKEPSDDKGIPSITSDIKPSRVDFKENGVQIDFPEAYLDMDRTREILVRASVVETLTQYDKVQRVSFLVNGEELKDSAGVVIGDMTADSFINNTGVELNSYERTNVTLYFTDIGGSALKTYDEDLVYNTNMAIEKFALETLIGGPQAVNEQEAFPTLSPDTKLLQVTVKDRIAYANFDTSVKEEPYSVDEETALYSIVNTLTSLPGIDKVQISIEGSTEGVFMDHMKLDELYERNDDLIN